MRFHPSFQKCPMLFRRVVCCAFGLDGWAPVCSFVPRSGGLCAQRGRRAGGLGRCGHGSRGLASSGLASSGLASSGLASSGLASSGLASSGLASPGLASPGLASPGLASPGLASPGLASPGLASPGLASPGLASPGLASPGLASPGLASPGGAACPCGARCAPPGARRAFARLSCAPCLRSPHPRPSAASVARETASFSAMRACRRS